MSLKTKIKPKHVLFFCPIFAFVVFLVLIFLIPYMSLHPAHWVLIGVLLIFTGAGIPLLVTDILSIDDNTWAGKK